MVLFSHIYKCDWAVLLPVQVCRFRLSQFLCLFCVFTRTVFFWACLETILPGADLGHRAQGRGPPLTQGNPFLLSAVIEAFTVDTSGVFRTQDRVQTVSSHHVVSEIHANAGLGHVVNGVDGSWRQG